MEILSLHHEKKDLVDIISLNGILNADTSMKLDELLQALSDADCPYILFEVADLTYLSSAGIGCFIGVIKKIRSRGGDLRFSNMGPKVKRVFDLLDMAEFFKYYDSLDEGINSFKTID